MLQIKKLIQIISSVAIILSIMWFWFEPSFEPAITTLAGIIGLIGSIKKQKENSVNSKDQIPKLFKRKRILYVDDDLLRTRFDMLEDNGYKVVPVNNANDALKEIKRSVFDAILLDVMMPPPNFVSKESVNYGYETGVYLAKEIKKSINNHTPIIVLTANPQPNVEAELKEIGVAAYLRKPFRQYELEEEINHAIYN